MSKCPDCGEYVFEVGDDVEIITSGLKGRIANCDGTHTYFEVWLYGMGTMYAVPEHMLMHIGEDEYHGPEGKAEPVASADVIDFTKAVDLRKAKARGAA